MANRTHPSSYSLERLWAGALGDDERASVEAHLAACAPCRARCEAMEAQAARFSASPQSSMARDRFVRADRRWKRNAAWVALAPVAAVLLLIVWRVTPVPPPAVATKEAAVAHRQGREVVEVRPGTSLPRLRSVVLRGPPVDVGQGVLEAATDSTSPSRPFVLQHTTVVAEVTGFVSAVTVTQEFKNPFPTPVDAVYVFPLPEDSAVDEMTFKAGSRVIRASIQRREEARRQYEEARALGRRAALLDEERPNIFTQSIANLMPGELVKVTLRYVAPLRYDDGAYTLNFPMVVGPRYVPGAPLAGEPQGTGTSPDTTDVPDASRITPPLERTGRDISIEVRLDAGTTIEELWSVSHRLLADRAASARAVITLDPADHIPNKDFILRWRVSGAEKRAAVLSSGGTFALMLNPEVRVAPNAVTPKEMVFVIDTSGSMQGEPLEAAKRAMALAMKQMNPGDTFMLIDFADRASSFDASPLPNTPTNVARALAYLAALPASGGTNQLEGIRAALSRPPDPARVRMVLLMTDGFIGNEQQIFAETQRLLGNARLFGFGVGNSVNHSLLSRLSAIGRGFYQYVRTNEDSTEAVGRFVRRLARPLLTDLEVDFGGLEVFDVLPRKIPDLFDTQPVVLLGRYRHPGRGQVRLRGRVAGQPVELTTDVTLASQDTSSGLKAMWARARIEELDTAQHLEGIDASREITTLGLEYHLVTPFTSFVAVDTEPQVSGNEPTGQSSNLDVGRGELSGERTGRLASMRSNSIQVVRGLPQPIEAAPPALKPPPRTHDDVALLGPPRAREPQANGQYQAPSPTALVDDVKDALTQADIMEVIIAHKAELTACADAQHRADRRLSGTLRLRWVVLPSGEVVAVAVESKEFEKTPVAACIVAIIEHLQFPVHVNQGPAVHFPFKF